MEQDEPPAARRRTNDDERTLERRLSRRLPAGFQTGLAPNGGGIDKPPEGGKEFPDIEGDRAAGDYRVGFRTGFADGYADGLLAGGNE